MDNKIIVPSADVLKANFGFLEDRDLTLLLEYTGLPFLVSDLTEKLNKQFNQGNRILERLLQLVTDD